MTAPGKRSPAARRRALATAAVVLAAAGGCAIDDRQLTAVPAGAGAGGAGPGGAAGDDPGGAAGAAGEAGEAGTTSGGSGQGGAGPGGSAGQAGVSGSSGQAGERSCLAVTDCDDLNPCTVDDCQNGACVRIGTDAIVPPPEPGNCRKEICKGGVVSATIDTTDKPSEDGNPCTVKKCSDAGEPVRMALDTGACSISNKNGVCTKGVCQVGCQQDGDCHDGNPCTSDTCQGKTCVFDKLADGAANPDAVPVDGDCKRGVCQDGVATDVADPSDVPPAQPCSQPTCSGSTPGYITADTGAPCGDGTICVSGVCQAPTCGDGVKTGDEQCDADDLGGQTCLDLTPSEGTLACKGDCTFDTTQCGSVCGDSKVGKGEECDVGDTAPGDGCSAYCMVEPQVGDLVITEVMINPESVDDAVGEWFEIYNAAGHSLDLRGVRVMSGGDGFVIKKDAPLTLEAGDYALLTRTSAEYNGGLDPFFSYGLSSPMFGFSNSTVDGIRVQIDSADGVKKTTIDEMSWVANAGKTYSGRSYSLRPDKLDAASNDTLINWCASKTAESTKLTDLGTPGKANDPCPLGWRRAVGSGQGAAVMTSSVTLWKCSTLVLAAALVVGVGGPRLGDAQAAGPARLTKALAALRTGKKMLDEAKEPPAGPHAQSVAAVNQAIAAVEREIKAYEAAAARAKPAGSAAEPRPAARKKEEKPKAPAPSESD